MPASQNSKKYPNGCVFAMNTAFQNWLAGQPGWAKWLEVAVGAAILVGVSFATFGAPEDAAAVIAADAADEAATDAALDVVVENEAGYVGGWYNDWGVFQVTAWTGEDGAWFAGEEYGMPYTLNFIPII